MLYFFILIDKKILSIFILFTTIIKNSFRAYAAGFLPCMAAALPPCVNAVFLSCLPHFRSKSRTVPLTSQAVLSYSE